MEGPDQPVGLKEVRFRFQHEGCWLQDTTDRFPGLSLVATGIYLRDEDVHMNVTVHAADPTQLDQAAAQWQQDDHIHRVTLLDRDARGARFHVSYSWEASIYRDILEHTPVSIGAIRFAKGVEYYQLIGELPDLRSLLQVLETKGALQVLSIRSAEEAELASDAAQGPWDALTEKQLQAVLAAEQAGYYRWPRACSASDLAEQLGLSSSAFLDHLRHAEAKLLSAMTEQLREREPARLEALLHRLRSTQR